MSINRIGQRVLKLLIEKLKFLIVQLELTLLNIDLITG